jgi:hypothetical protein
MILLLAGGGFEAYKLHQQSLEMAALQAAMAVKPVAPPPVAKPNWLAERIESRSRLLDRSSYHQYQASTRIVQPAPIWIQQTSAPPHDCSTQPPRRHAHPSRPKDLPSELAFQWSEKRRRFYVGMT